MMHFTKSLAILATLAATIGLAMAAPSLQERDITEGPPCLKAGFSGPPLAWLRQALDYHPKENVWRDKLSLLKATFVDHKMKLDASYKLNDVFLYEIVSTKGEKFYFQLDVGHKQVGDTVCVNDQGPTPSVAAINVYFEKKY